MLNYFIQNYSTRILENGQSSPLDDTFAPMLKDIRNYDFQNGFKHEIEVLSLQNLPDAHRTRITFSHRANFYIIIWFTNGTYEHQLDFTTVEVPNNSFLFVNKGQVHSFDKNKALDGKLFYLLISFSTETPVAWN